MRTVPIHVRLAPGLIQKLDDLAESLELDRSAVIRRAVTEATKNAPTLTLTAESREQAEQWEKLAASMGMDVPRLVASVMNKLVAKGAGS